LRPTREIRASDAKTHLPRLLDEVERGETIVITRHGRAIARLVPEADRRQAEIDRAIDNIRALRKRTGKITRDELLSARHEGHRYWCPSSSTPRSPPAGRSTTRTTRTPRWRSNASGAMALPAPGDLV
jgi:prevent-host-death family protein